MSVVGLMNVSHALLATAIGGEISGLIETSGLVAKTVLVILLVFSVASWAIIFSKWGLFRRARAQSNRFMRMFRKSERLNDVAAVVEQFKPSPLVAVFEGAYDELRKQATHPIRVAGAAARNPDRIVGRTVATGKPLALAGDDRRGDAVHRTVRNGVGHH